VLVLVLVLVFIKMAIASGVVVVSIIFFVGGGGGGGGGGDGHGLPPAVPGATALGFILNCSARKSNVCHVTATRPFSRVCWHEYGRRLDSGTVKDNCNRPKVGHPNINLLQIKHCIDGTFCSFCLRPWPVPATTNTWQCGSKRVTTKSANFKRIWFAHPVSDDFWRDVPFVP